MTHGSRPLARASAVLAAAALGVFTALGSVASASATPTYPPPNIDPQATGSVTLQKLVQPETPSGLPHDGTEVDTTGLTPLNDVEFTIQLVGGIDLTTNEGWEETQGLTAAMVLADPVNYPLGPGTSEVTDVDGYLTFDDLPIGVYLITETDTGPHNIAFGAQPFLVSIPLPHDDTWLYDIFVYPKNSLTDVTKTVDDSAAYGLGDSVTWTIQSVIPTLTEGSSLTNYTITDVLDPRLDFINADVSVVGAPVTLDPGVDFTVDETGQTVTIDFLPSGLGKLLLAQGASVQVELHTTVVALGDGFIRNSALLNVNDTDFDSNIVETKWGALVIFKYVASGKDEVPLQGAEFQLFRSLVDAQNRTNPIGINGQFTFPSGADGLAVFPGLKAGNYYLVETKAPLGYTASSTPIPVTVVAGKTSLTTVDYKVQNTQIPPFILPLTGGTGVTLFVAGGAALLVAAAALGLLARRRDSARSGTSV